MLGPDSRTTDCRGPPRHFIYLILNCCKLDSQDKHTLTHPTFSIIHIISGRPEITQSGILSMGAPASSSCLRGGRRHPTSIRQEKRAAPRSPAFQRGAFKVDRAHVLGLRWCARSNPQAPRQRARRGEKGRDWRRDRSGQPSLPKKRPRRRAGRRSRSSSQLS